jgi:hypothetical protein
MMRTSSIQASALLATMLLAAPSLCAAAHDEEARALVKGVIDSAPDVPSVARMRLTTPGGLERLFTLWAKPLGDDLDGRYLEVTSPVNLQDTRYLFYERTVGEDEQYVYMPSMKRAIRLSETSRREPFLSSNFYIIDMVEPALDDFTYRFVGEEEVGGRACRLVESTPKNPAKEFYGRTVSAIDPQDLIVMRTHLYDPKGELTKVLTVEKIEKIDGFWTPLLERMDNIRDKTTSELQTLEIRYREPLTDEIFHISHLVR